MTDEFVELHGDRLFGDDEAMVAGLARLDGRPVVVIGQQKGADTDENIRRNFGMPHPEGYRKAMRVMELAERFGLPVVTFVDVPGAHPGPESEERGIAEAIARSVGADDPPADADRHGHHRRGRLGRRARDRRRRRRHRARERGLLGHQPGGLRLDPVADRRRGADRRGRDAHDRRRPARARRHRHRRRRSRARAPTPTPPRPPGACGRSSSTGSRRSSALTIDELVEQRYRRYRALGSYTEAELPEIVLPAGRGLGDRLRDLLDPGRRAVGGAVPSWSRDEPPAREEV